MADEKVAQTFENHHLKVYLYYRVLIGILLLNLGWQLFRIVTDFSLDRVFHILLILAIGIITLYLRIWPLTALDRVIRLEMQVRLEALLPAEQRASISELTLGQLIALRFAGDDELPDLCRRVQDEKITERNAIKKLIRSWKPDHLRI